MLHPQWSYILRPQLCFIYGLTKPSPDRSVAGGGAGVHPAGHPTWGDGLGLVGEIHGG